jgi:DNA-binding NtrC family response regulator
MHRATVLVVDDDATLLESLCRALHRTYTVLLAETAAEAFEILARERVDVVLSDHHMPGMTGLDFLRQVAVRHTDVVRMLYTAQPDTEMAIRAINQGDVFRILTKPVALAEVQVALHLAVEKLEIDRENRALRAVVAAHPELQLELDLEVARAWESLPSATSLS